jgi:hypothetical protein
MNKIYYSENLSDMKFVINFLKEHHIELYAIKSFKFNDRGFYQVALRDGMFLKYCYKCKTKLIHDAGESSDCPCQCEHDDLEPSFDVHNLYVKCKSCGDDIPLSVVKSKYNIDITKKDDKE